MVPVKNTSIAMEKKFEPDYFDDIRPYRDDEVPKVIESLIQKNEIYFRISKMAFPRINKITPSWGALISRLAIASRLKNVKDIRSFQINITGWFFFRMLDKTTDEINYTWHSELERTEGHLLLSNHRDIAVDPAVVSHALYTKDLALPMIGIGDNLLSNEYATAIMKLNQSFIVKRSSSSVRDILADMNKLSQFIRHSVADKNNNLWLAHREGRAKDGRDRTSQAVLKMLRLSEDKNMSWSDALNPLNIRTVSISYQYDPCIIHKARELVEGKREKVSGGDATDLDEMAQGMTGYKGKVYLAVGKKHIWGKDDNPKTIISALDKEIICNYELQDSHFYALKKLGELGLEDKAGFEEAVELFKPSSVDSSYLDKQLSHAPNQDIYIKCLQIYANPVLERITYYNQ